jgi:hypothetical protein
MIYFRSNAQCNKKNYHYSEHKEPTLTLYGLTDQKPYLSLGDEPKQEEKEKCDNLFACSSDWQSLYTMI